MLWRRRPRPLQQLAWRALLPPTLVALLVGAVVLLFGAQATAAGWQGHGTA